MNPSPSSEALERLNEIADAWSGLNDLLCPVTPGCDLHLVNRSHLHSLTTLVLREQRTALQQLHDELDREARSC